MSEHSIDRRFRLNGASDISVSFEFFPPKSEKMEQSLWSAVKRLEPLAPSFVSVTYGAGGSTRERTHATVSRIVKETALKPAAHLTCVDASKEEVNEVIQSYWDAGVRHIVALRGDPATGLGEAYAPHEGGYQTTADLVASIRSIGDFEVSVSAYPEKHPESPSWDVELDVLKAKVDAGATRAITQFFSIMITTSDMLIGFVLLASLFRSFRVSCLLPASKAFQVLRRKPAHLFRVGWRTALTGWMMIHGHVNL